MQEYQSLFFWGFFDRLRRDNVRFFTKGAQYRLVF